MRILLLRDVFIRVPFSNRKLPILPSVHTFTKKIYRAISRKVIGKSAGDNPEKYCGCGFEFTVLQRNLQEWHERP